MSRGSFTESITILTNAKLPNPAFTFNGHPFLPIIFHRFSRCGWWQEVGSRIRITPTLSHHQAVWTDLREASRILQFRD